MRDNNEQYIVDETAAAETAAHPATASAHTTHSSRNRIYWLAGSGVAASLFLMMAAFGTVQDPGPFPLLTQPIERELSPQVVVLDQDNSADFVHEERFQRGDTFAAFLERLGVNDADAERLLGNRNAVGSLRVLRPGMTVHATTNADGQLKELSFLSGQKILSIDATTGTAAGGFQAHDQAASLTREVAMKSGVIRSSLFAATDDANVPDSVATQMADIFGSDVDFHRDLRRGDHFTVVYEQYTLESQDIRAGRVLAAEFTNNNHTYRAVWYDDKNDGQGNYYTPEGRSLRKSFLKSPLEFTRITSGVSMRFHPILKQWRQHEGIDFGAPMGARVKVTADGVVAFEGWENGYGNVIMVNHTNGYSTRYAHLSGFAAGLKRGDRVSQGQVIGFVGMTGLATGPHLHYEFRINGVYTNFLTMKFPSSDPISRDRQVAFHVATDPLSRRLDLLQNSNIASLE